MTAIMSLYGTAVLFILAFVGVCLYDGLVDWRIRRRVRSIPPRDRCPLCQGTGLGCVAVGKPVPKRCEACWGTGRRR